MITVFLLTGDERSCPVLEGLFVPWIGMGLSEGVGLSGISQAESCEH